MELRVRRDEGAFYVACLIFGGLSGVWWAADPAPLERFAILFMGAAVVGGIAIAALLVWVGYLDG